MKISRFKALEIRGFCSGYTPDLVEKCVMPPVKQSKKELIHSLLLNWGQYISLSYPLPPRTTKNRRFPNHGRQQNPIPHPKKRGLKSIQKRLVAEVVSKRWGIGAGVAVSGIFWGVG